LLKALDDTALETLASLAPVVSELRHNGTVNTRAFAHFHSLGMPSTLLVHSRPARREKERIEVSLVSGNAVQLALDFDGLRIA
jgi:hypothetical protein